MKALIFTVLFASPLLYVGTRMFCTPCGGAAAARDAVQGQYLEVRSASVFAGPCHVNGEYDLQGRRALLAWQLAAGTWDGVDLSGAEVACAVGAGENLAEGGDRTSIVYVDEGLSVEARDAVRSWLETNHEERLGVVAAVRPVELDLAFDGDDYRLEIPGVASVRGAALADRSCCSMASEVWYEPLAAVDGAIVGNSAICRFEGDSGIDAWAYQDENNAFVAAFEDVAVASACAALPVADEASECCASVTPTE